MEIIKFKEVECRLNIEKPILKDLNIDILDGFIYGIIGNSESGKTSFLELINKTKPITKGEIILNTKKIAFVNYKEDFLMDTIEKELKEVLVEKNIKNNSLILKSLNMVGLNKYYLALNTNKISLSEKRLLSISKALITSPKVLLLDDITSGLDRNSKKELLRLLKDINKKYNVTILIASNDINFINLISTHLIVLDNGKVIVEGLKENVFNKDALLNKRKINLPDILEFINKVEDENKIKLGIYDDVKDLIKAVYRNV